MPAVYKAVGSADARQGKTSYLGVKGKGYLFSGDENGVKFQQIRDGTSNTILVVEALPEKAVVWTKPDDFEPDLKNPVAGLANKTRTGFNTLFTDGSVRYLQGAINVKTLLALFTRSGGEVIQDQ